MSNADLSLASILLMDGVHILGVGPEIQGPTGPGWVATWAADFNGDGMNDVLWKNSQTGAIAVWLMSGVHVRARGGEIPSPAGPDWHVIAADMNFDNMSDAVWNNQSPMRWSYGS